MIIRILLVLLLCASPVFAVEPDEILPDPIAEERARDISKNLRCLVCRNENIDSSNAGIAKDLRILVRERIVAGDTDKEVMNFVVDRYGEFVLLNPRFSVTNLFLWLAGPFLLLTGAVIAFRFVNKPEQMATDTLGENEEKRLKEILNE